VPSLEAAGFTMFIIVLFVGGFSTIFGFPGMVLILIDIVVFSWCTSFDVIGFKLITAFFLTVLVAEASDFSLGMIGAKKFGTTKGEFFSTVIGAFLGILIATPFLMGLGILTGAYVGGFIGMFIVAYVRNKNTKPSFRRDTGHFAVKMTAVFCKEVLATAMIIITMLQIYS